MPDVDGVASMPPAPRRPTHFGRRTVSTRRDHLDKEGSKQFNGSAICPPVHKSVRGPPSDVETRSGQSVCLPSAFTGKVSPIVKDFGRAGAAS